MLTEIALKSFGQSHVGAVRKINEDSLLEYPEQHIWVVADGMGGHAAGDVASQMLVDTITLYINEHAYHGISINVLKQAIQTANEKIMAYSHSQLAGKTAGTTVVLLWIDGYTAHWLWAGDSRGYRFYHQDLKQVTRDHSHVNELIDQGVLSPEEAEKHPMGNVITRVIGVVDDIDVDHISHPVVEGEMLLLCSDGLTGELTDACIAEQLQLQQHNVINAGSSLMHAALGKAAKDNVSLILVSVSRPSQADSFKGDDLTVPLFS
ncbi:MAG: serine/threonine protein phosphatase PrpC [Moritella dasanensis]|jgi:serine/threonine protein phosphatase PrpC